MKNENIKPKKKNIVKTLLIIGGIFVGLFIVIAILASIFVDPVVNWSNLKTPTNQKIISISGTTKSKTGKAKLINNNQEIKSISIDNKKFNFEAIELNEGENKLKVEIINENSEIKMSASYTIILDTTKPEIILNDFNSETNQEKTSLSGKTEENSEVKLLKDKQEVKKVKTKEGIFNFDDVKLNEGENKFTIVAIDQVGNESNKKEITIIYKPNQEQVNSKNNQTNKQEIDNQNSTAYKLATIQAGDIPEQSLIDEFDRILKSINQEYPDMTEERISDIICSVTEQIQAKGGNIDFLETAKALDEATPEGTQELGVKLEEVGASLVVMMTSN